MSRKNPNRTEAPTRMPVVLAPRDELWNRETSRLLEGIITVGWFICGRDHLRLRLVLFCILGSDLNDPFDSRHQIVKHIVFLNKIVSAGLKCQFAIIRFVLQGEYDDTRFWAERSQTGNAKKPHQSWAPIVDYDYFGLKS